MTEVTAHTTLKCDEFGYITLIEDLINYINMDVSNNAASCLIIALSCGRDVSTKKKNQKEDIRISIVRWTKQWLLKRRVWTRVILTKELKENNLGDSKKYLRI